MTPPFSEILREKFLSGQSNQFLIYGNVQDLYFLDEEYRPLLDYLNRFLGKTRRLQIHFNIAGGIRFFSPADQNLVLRAYRDAVFLGGTPQSRESWFKKALVESAVYPQVGIKFIQELLLLKIPDSQSSPKYRQFSVIMDYAETIAPSAPNQRLSDGDRQKLVILSQWLSNPAFIRSSHMAVFLCETASMVNDSIVNLPSMTPIALPRPAEATRLHFIRYQYHHFEKKVRLKCSQKRLANLTAGLSLKGIEHLFLSAAYSGEKLDENRVLEKTNEILKKELGDTVEIYSPRHTMKSVVGAHRLKTLLREQKSLIKLGDPEVCPVGILASGPNGVGKTFIFEAFAGSIGYNIIKLKKIRSQWFGQTDIIFEKIRSVLTGIGKVVVLIDEADTAFGGRGATAHETEKRLFGNLIQMMGDPANRGKIIWILITARPDRLEPDVKRSGRAGLHLPVFDPEGEERLEFIRWLFKEIGQDFDKLGQPAADRFLEITHTFSAADFNELMVLLNSRIRLRRSPLDPGEVLEAALDFNPSTLSRERRYQTVVAALECSFSSLLPDSLKDREALLLEKASLKRELGY